MKDLVIACLAFLAGVLIFWGLVLLVAWGLDSDMAHAVIIVLLMFRHEGTVQEEEGK